MKKLPINENLIKNSFVYHQGVLYWAVSPNIRVATGDVAGCDNESGYWTIFINGNIYQRSRLVYAFHYGDPGELEIDHINRDQSDDRIENLRTATRLENQQNRGRYKNNTTGVAGISVAKQTKRGPYYLATLQVAGEIHTKASYDLDFLINWREELKKRLNNHLTT